MEKDTEGIGFSSTTCRRNAVLPAGPEDFGLQNCKIISVCCYSHSRKRTAVELFLCGEVRCGEDRGEWFLNYFLKDSIWSQGKVEEGGTTAASARTDSEMLTSLVCLGNFEKFANVPVNSISGLCSSGATETEWDRMDMKEKVIHLQVTVVVKCYFLPSCHPKSSGSCLKEGDQPSTSACCHWNLIARGCCCAFPSWLSAKSTSKQQGWGEMLQKMCSDISVTLLNQLFWTRNFGSLPEKERQPGGRKVRTQLRADHHPLGRKSKKVLMFSRKYISWYLQPCLLSFALLHFTNVACFTNWRPDPPPAKQL